MKKKYLWKSMRAGLKSSYGTIDWKVGEWYVHDGEPETCDAGFHASENVMDAIGYVPCEVLCKVEVRGKSDISYDKQAWSEMKIVKAYHWGKADSVALAIFAADEVLAIYEKEYPNDDRPRKAIEAAKAYLKNPTYEAAEAAARAAGAAGAAARAAGAAGAAAWAAAGAAEAAEAAAGAAEAAAEAAAGAARAAAWAAAWAEMKAKCADFVIKRIKKLELYHD